MADAITHTRIETVEMRGKDISGAFQDELNRRIQLLHEKHKEQEFGVVNVQVITQPVRYSNATYNQIPGMLEELHYLGIITYQYET
jgi:hypothetical protein